MKTRFLRPTLAAGIAVALGVLAADHARTPGSPAASAGLQHDQVVAWTATPRMTAPANASWEALMHASWR